MKPDASPLVGKLTLLVLTLILVCLVVLVYRSFQRPSREIPLALAEAAPTPIDETPPRLVTPSAPAIKRSVPAAAMPSAATNSNTTARTNPPALATAVDEKPTAIGRVSFGPTDPRPSEIYETLAANGSALLAGMVTLKGTPKPETPIGFETLGPTCGALNLQPLTTRHFVVGPQGQLANVVVYIKSGLQRKFGPVQPGPLIDQVGCMFEPYISGVVAGQTFQVRNSDPTLHNLHATPRNNKEFNIGQAVKGQVNTLSFAKPEMHTRIKCDVHPWMFTYVNVFDHPYFAITDTNGFFQLPAQLPAGNYVIAATHLKLGTELRMEVNLREGEQRSLMFEFQVPSNLQAPASVAHSN